MPRPRAQPTDPAKRSFKSSPKVTLALDDEVERLLKEAMAESGVKSKSQMVRYCIAAALGHPLQRQAIYEAEVWFRGVSQLIFRKFAARFTAELPSLIEETMFAEGIASDDEDDED